LHVQRLEAPAERAKLHAVETSLASGRRVAALEPAAKDADAASREAKARGRG
jgi:hypothetical protein